MAPNVVFLHAANDSVSYTAQTKLDGAKQKYPLGSEFIVHSLYINRANGLRLEQRRPGTGTKYLIVDTIKKWNWVYLDSTKNILGYNCKKAVIHQDRQATVAWYAPEISTTSGAFGYGGLPGFILELYYPQQDIKRTAISIKFEDVAIIEPTKGKRISMASFDKKFTRY